MKFVDCRDESPKAPLYPGGFLVNEGEQLQSRELFFGVLNLADMHAGIGKLVTMEAHEKALRETLDWYDRMAQERGMRLRLVEYQLGPFSGGLALIGTPLE